MTADRNRELVLAADTKFNRGQLAQPGVEMISMPEIRGRIAVRKHATGGRLSLGSGVVINSSLDMSFGGRIETSFWLLSAEATIELGDRVHMSNVAIAARRGIHIADDVWLGTGSQIIDTDFHSLDFAERVANVAIPAEPVRIGERAFIGMNVLVLKGVTVGADSVIGAGAVVTRDVPAGEIWGGNPARCIRKR